MMLVVVFLMMRMRLLNVAIISSGMEVIIIILQFIILPSRNHTDWALGGIFFQMVSPAATIIRRLAIFEP